MADWVAFTRVCDFLLRIFRLAASSLVEGCHRGLLKTERSRLSGTAACAGRYLIRCRLRLGVALPLGRVSSSSELYEKLRTFDIGLLTGFYRVLAAGLDFGSRDPLRKSLVGRCRVVRGLKALPGFLQPLEPRMAVWGVCGSAWAIVRFMFA
jgi:hypothetical protein